MAGIDVSSREIVQGVIDALRAEFGPGCVCYADKVPQNFQTPSFFVRQISGSKELVLGRRYLRRCLIRVTYFADDRGAPASELNGVADRLFPALEYISMGGVAVRGTGMECEMEDSELHFSVRYDIFVLRAEEPAPAMGVFIQEQHVKEQ